MIGISLAILFLISFAWVLIWDLLPLNNINAEILLGELTLLCFAVLCIGYLAFAVVHFVWGY